MPIYIATGVRASFAEECRRQCQQAIAVDLADPGLYQVEPQPQPQMIAPVAKVGGGAGVADLVVDLEGFGQREIGTNPDIAAKAVVTDASLVEDGLHQPALGHRGFGINPGIQEVLVNLP